MALCFVCFSGVQTTPLAVASAQDGTGVPGLQTANAATTLLGLSSQELLASQVSSHACSLVWGGRGGGTCPLDNRLQIFLQI